MQLHCGDAWLCDDDPVQPVRVRLFLSFLCIFFSHVHWLNSLSVCMLFSFLCFWTEIKLSVPKLYNASQACVSKVRTMTLYYGFSDIFGNFGSLLRGQHRDPEIPVYVVPTYYIEYLKISVPDYRYTYRAVETYDEITINVYQRKWTNFD